MSSLTDSRELDTMVGAADNASCRGCIGEPGSSCSLMRESTDWEDGTRILGGTANWKAGDGELGWLGKGEVSEQFISLLFR